VSTFLDAKEISLYRSPSGLLHVGAWFGETICSAWHGNPGWRHQGLTSLRQLGRMSRRPNSNNMCKRCANEYKDVNVNG
jgi:hypothetical protein